MSRDEKPYEDERRDPEMTGDVLSPRWNADAADTDEQPAIVVGSGDVAYLLPADPPTPPADVLDPEPPSTPGTLLGADPAPGTPLGAGPVSGSRLGPDLASGADLRAGQHSGSGAHPTVDPLASGPHLVSGSPSGAHPTVDSLASGPHPVSGASGAHPVVDPRSLTGDALSQDLSPSGPHAVSDPHLSSVPSDLLPGAEDSEPAYLPLDRGYEQPREDDEEPRRGFLGSGWMEEPDQGTEVRRRTRILIAGAAAVVLVGVAGGWLMSSSSTAGDCPSGQCVSVGKHTPMQNPAGSPEPSPSSDPESPDPDATASGSPTPTTEHARATRQPTPKASPTRVGVATTKPSAKPTRDVSGDVETVDQPHATTTPPSTKQTDAAQPTQSSQTTAPAAPTTPPTQAGNGGLLDLLFGWAK